MTEAYHRRSLITLPDEIILYIFYKLDPYDILSLSLVSRKLHQVSELFTVWYHVFLNLLHRARYIDLLAVDQKPLNKVTMHELRKSVILAARAERNWSGEKPTVREPPQTIELEELVHADATLDRHSYMIKFSSKHMLVPLEGGTLYGWNMKDNTNAGCFDIGPESMISDVALEGSSGTLLSLITRTSPIRSGNRIGLHVRFSVLRIAVPGADAQSTNLGFDRSKEVTLCLPFSSQPRILDISRRMFYVAFPCGEVPMDTLAILIVLDWDTEKAAIINTGIPYDYARSLIGGHLSPDREHFVVVSESDGREIRRWYRLSDLNPSLHVWNTLEYEPGVIAVPAKQEVFEWVGEPSVLSKTSGAEACMFWTMDQLPEPPYPEVPPRVSTVVLYLSTSPGVDRSEKTWRVAQHYSDENGPTAPSRSVVTLRSPALDPFERDEPMLPIVCVSFNHFGWIEEVEEDGKRVRRMKLVTFPDPGTTYDGDLGDTASTLDIPSDVLESAYHVILDATQGLILIATQKQTLHVYRY